jgi:hypothetical protein
MTKNNRSNQHGIIQNKNNSEEEKVNKKVNLLDMVADNSVDSILEVVKLDDNETAIIPFTAEGEKAELHYCSEDEIKGYVHCNGPGCVLCRIGRKLEKRSMLPVYLPMAGYVAILLVSPSRRPYSLLPQITNILKSDKPMVAFVTRAGFKYTVSQVELKDDEDGGEAVIQRFLDEYEAGLHDLSTVCQSIENDELANIESISRMLKLKGVQWDGGDKRS